MDAVVVRAGVDEDVPALRDVFRRASWSNLRDRPVLTEHPELLDWSPAAIPEGRVRVACVAGRVVGFASTASHGDTVEIEDLFVDPGSSRQGIGRRLVEDVVARSTLMEARQIEVDAGEDAVAFYQRVGFARVGTVPVEYGVAVRLVREIPRSR